MILGIVYYVEYLEYDSCKVSNLFFDCSMHVGFAYSGIFLLAYDESCPNFLILILPLMVPSQSAAWHCLLSVLCHNAQGLRCALTRDMVVTFYTCAWD